MATLNLQGLLGLLGGKDEQTPAATTERRGANIGSLLGGPRDDIVEPIIGKDGLKSARMSALLSLGTAMLSQSGYSRMPITTGQALGAGLQAAQQGYAQALDSSIGAAGQVQQMRKLDTEMQRKKMMMDAAQRMLGGDVAPQGGAPQPGVPGAGPAPGGAPAAAGPAPGGNPMAQGMPQMPAPGADMPPPAAAAVAGAQQTPGMGQQQPTFGRREAMAMTLLDPSNSAAYENIYQMQNPELKQLADGSIVDMRDPSLAGQVRPQLDNGMVRGPDGRVGLAPGYLEAQGQLQMQKAYADRSQDLVDVVIPGQGVVKVPRAQMQTGLTMGPNGQPVPTLGGPGGFLSAEDPAALKEREGNVASFLKARETAATESQAAGEELNSLDNVSNLLREANPGLGQGAKLALGRVLDATGLATGDQSKWVANASAFQMAQRQTAMARLKNAFGGNITEGERAFLMESLGNLDAPAAAIATSVDVARVAAERKQAYSDFLQNYDGDRAKFEQAWRRSGEGSKTTFDYPQMWKYLPVQRGRAGTPAEGKTFVKTPRGSIYPVQVGPDGVPVPVGE